MKLLVILSLCCLLLAINAATLPFNPDQEQLKPLSRKKRAPFLLTLGLLGAAGLVKAGIAGLAGAGLVGAGLGAKAGFAAGTLVGSAARSYGGGTYYYSYSKPVEYRAQVSVQG